MDIEKIKVLAENDDTSAQNDLGIAYMTGAGVELNEQKGAYWFHRASTQGSSEAMANLGMCVLLGRGVEKDVGAALYILESAFLRGAPNIVANIFGALQNKDLHIEEIIFLANQKNSQAEWVLGLCYDHGICFDEDHQKALEFFASSSEKDNPVALWILAHFIAAQSNPDLLYAKHCLDKVEEMAMKQVGGLNCQQIQRDVFDVETRLREECGSLLMKVIPECDREGKPKDQYVQDFLDGKLFMKTLDQFGDLTKRDVSSDNDFRGDILEGYSESFGLGYNPNFYKTDSNGEIIKDGQLGSIDIHALRKKIFCLATIEYYKPRHACIIPSPKMKEFGKYAVIITDVEAFIKRVHTAFDMYRREKGASYCLAYDRVSYDVDLNSKQRFNEFHKSRSYSWQNEFRISLDFSDGKYSTAMLEDVTDFAKILYPGKIEVNDDPLFLSDWMYFEIGDIRDICQYVEIDDLYNGVLSFNLKNEPMAIKPFMTPHELRPTFCKAVSAIAFSDGTYRLAVSKEAFYAGNFFNNE